jgi:hypothetical protein
VFLEANWKCLRWQRIAEYAEHRPVSGEPGAAVQPAIVEHGEPLALPQPQHPRVSFDSSIQAGPKGRRRGREPDKIVESQPNRDPVTWSRRENRAEVATFAAEVCRAGCGQGSQHGGVRTGDIRIELPAVNQDAVAADGCGPQADQDENSGRSTERRPLGVRLQFAVAEAGEAGPPGSGRAGHDRRDSVEVAVTMRCDGNEPPGGSERPLRPETPVKVATPCRCSLSFSWLRAIGSCRSIIDGSRSRSSCTCSPLRLQSSRTTVLACRPGIK